MVEVNMLPYATEQTQRIDQAIKLATAIHESCGRLFAAVDTSEAVGVVGIGDAESYARIRATLQHMLDLTEDTINALKPLFSAGVEEIERMQMVLKAEDAIHARRGGGLAS